MKNLLYVIVIALFGASCTKRVYIPLENHTVSHDTLKLSTFVRDTLVLRDSVVRDLRGDTVREKVVRERWRLRTLHDTTYLTHRDTVIVERSVAAEDAYNVTTRGSSEASRYLWFGILMLAAAMVWMRKSRS